MRCVALHFAGTGAYMQDHNRLVGGASSLDGLNHLDE
jgi:hypothetical protein